MALSRFCRSFSRVNPLKSIKSNVFQSSQRNIAVSIINTPEECYELAKEKDPHQTEFLQAVYEVIISCKPLFEKYPDYTYVLPLMCEPERVIQFRVPWVDDQGHTHINRGYRVQFSQALGPYKGGLRFHPSVSKSIMKFLAFEQVFKNALTGLPMGGAKGGSDFNPKGKTNSEVLRFCQNFMSELYKHIGPYRDVPAGDIGVGGREIGYLFGEYKRITALHEGVLTGKGIGWGGSNIRTEATGYGLIYLTKLAIESRNDTFTNKKCVVSGSGNVAEYTAEKLMELGATVVSFSDSDGSIIEKDGFTSKQFEILRNIKKKRGRCKDYLKHSNTATFIQNEQPWKHVKNIDCAFPCATQNELNKEDAIALVNNGVKYVGEGANMPCDIEAIDVFQNANNVVFLPAKAANAGGVAVSGLEMTQNSQHYYWTRQEVDNKLKDIMKDIYTTITNTSDELGRHNDYLLGANAAGFKMVADAMFDYGQPMKSWAIAVEKEY